MCMLELIFFIKKNKIFMDSKQTQITSDFFLNL